MKRGAEKQLSKDDDPDDEVEEVQTGFQMAKGSELARREIRGLPKRRSPAVAPALGVPPPPPSSTNPAVTPKFGSFSGFGSTSGATTPFTFAPAGPPQKPAEAPQPSAIQTSVPAVSENASNATKKFASFLGPSSTAGAKPVLSSETPKADASGDTDEVALKYYTSLRGLNSSFLSAVSKAIESDPFVDIADILEQYKKHRISVQQEYDGKSSQATAQSAPSPPSKPSVPAAPFSFGKPATSAPATMPAPPPSFAGFPAQSATLGSIAPATGFTPSLAAPTIKPSPLTFPSTTPTSSDPKPGGVGSSSSLPGFAGGTSSSSFFKSTASLTSKEAESAPPLKHTFSFGAPAPAGPTLSAFPFGGGQPSFSTPLFGNPPKTSALFGSDKAAPEDRDQDKDKPASSAPALGQSPFSIAPGTKLMFGDTAGSSSSGSVFSTTTTKSADEKDKEKEREREKDNKLPPLGSVFGSPFGSPAKLSPFTFGGAASGTPATFGFGVASSASEGSPPPKAGSVGFSFGSPSRTPPQTTPVPSSIFGSASASASVSASSTTAVPASTPGSTHVDVPASAASRADTPATEGSQDDDGLARTQSPGLHGGEGEGEEDEETTHTVKAKVFKFTTDREGAPTWSEMGIGMLRLKKHTETNARRIILRSTTTGKIIINFRIYSGLQPKRTGKTVAFTGHITSPGKDAQTVQYRLRVASEAVAIEMAEAIEREVRLVQAEATPSS
ncbi:hypothetical protein BJV78DRAFT_1188183 [Lactifluus subvellereus]|nr:hypothetical protein BJV78DRAFT_1188183 [Lactifluus subvellereus]